MYRLLALGILVGACSGNVAQEATPSGGAGADPTGSSPMVRGDVSSSGSSVTATAGSGGADNATAGATAAGSSQAGAITTGGSDGQPPSGGSSGAGATAAGTGGVPAQAGATGEAGAAPVEAQGGDGVAGGEAAAGAPADPCAGVAHWNPTDKITDYTKRPADADSSWHGDLRVFGGILWAAQEPGGCQTYPGHSSGHEGWLEIATCAGGPVTETAACQCAAGSCCDGCYLRGQSYFCGETVRAVRCSAGHGGVVDSEGDYWNLFCDGLSAGDCTRWAAHTKFASGVCQSGVTCTSTTDETSCN